jgi:hypothetical protein
MAPNALVDSCQAIFKASIAEAHVVDYDPIW